MTKNAFFLKVIWSARKNVVTLHRKLMSGITWDRFVSEFADIFKAFICAQF